MFKKVLAESRDPNHSGSQDLMLDEGVVASRWVERLHLPIWSVVVLCAAIVYAYAPGHMDADVLGILGWVRTGAYRDWYPLLFPSMLTTAVKAGIGPTGVLAFQVFAIGLSTYAIVNFFARPVIAAIGTYFVLLSPAVLGYLGALTSHAILTAFLLSGYVGLLYLQRSAPGRARGFLLAFTFIALAAASIARQTALTFTVPAFCLWVNVLRDRFHFHKLRTKQRRLVIAGSGFLLSIVSVLAGNEILALIYHPVHTGPVQGIALYDISAISLRANKLFLDRQHFPDQKLEDLRRIFLKNNPDVLFFLGDPRTRVQIIPSGDQSEVLRMWRGCIAMYPGYYLTERWQMFIGLLGLDFRVLPVVPYHPGIDANNLGYHLLHMSEDAAR